MEPERDKTSLVVDASSSSVQVGLAEAEGWTHLETLELPPLEGLFAATARVLKKGRTSLSEIEEIFFCEGPGSTLGLRITAAFVKSILWEREGKVSLFAYNALDLACRMGPKPPLRLQAPFRKGWRFLRTQEGENPIGHKQIMESEEAFARFPESHHLPDYRSPQDSVPPSLRVTYDLAETGGLEDLEKVSTPTDSPSVYSPKPPAFKKWEPVRTPSPER